VFDIEADLGRATVEEVNASQAIFPHQVKPAATDTGRRWGQGRFQTFRQRIDSHFDELLFLTLHALTQTKQTAPQLAETLQTDAGWLAIGPAYLITLKDTAVCTGVLARVAAEQRYQKARRDWRYPFCRVPTVSCIARVTVGDAPSLAIQGVAPRCFQAAWHSSHPFLVPLPKQKTLFRPIRNRARISARKARSPKFGVHCYEKGQTSSRKIFHALGKFSARLGHEL
jgi:hypothetical protein